MELVCLASNCLYLFAGRKLQSPSTSQCLKPLRIPEDLEPHFTLATEREYDKLMSPQCIILYHSIQDIHVFIFSILLWVWTLF